VTPTTIALALAIGLGMGLLGGGGSILAVPALTFLLHFPPKDAVATSLAVIGLTAAAGAAGSFVRGVLPLTVALTVGLSATVGAYGGGIAGARLPDQIQLSLLAVLMLTAAVVLWRRPDVERPPVTRERPAVLAAIGMATGILTGLVGVGGGFLIVPALVIGAGLTMQKAAAASLFAIALAAGAALPGYLATLSLSWAFILPFAAMASIAAVIGGVAAQHLPQRRLQQAFACALVVLATYVMIKS
jgi:uncharacterized membrane protein YfcA